MDDRCFRYHAIPVALIDWSESVLIAELCDEPAFSEDMDALRRRLEDAADQECVPHVILNFQNVSNLGSMNVSQLLTLRKKLTLSNRKLRVCAVNDSIWSIMLTTGLDRIFSFTEDISTSLPSLQIE